jgi:hypothetical protein
VRPHLGRITAAAAHAGRRYWRQILAVAIPVTIVSAGLEILIEHFVDPNDPVLSASATLTATFISMLGTVLLSGFVCRLAGAAGHGWEPVTLWQAVRSMPWRRLIGADLLVTAVVVGGLLLFVLPGLVALTFLAVVGPVVEIEHRQVWDAVRRSVHLVRHHVLAVILLGTLPIAATAELEAVAPQPHHADEIAQFLLIRGVAEGVVEACIALVLAELCFQLIEAERAAGAVSQAGPATGEMASGGVPESRRHDRRVADHET